MTHLSDWIRDRLAERGWQQKQLAHEWQAEVGEGSVGTYESRVSKIMRDDDDGYAYLVDDPKRLSRFAKLMGTDADDVRRRIESERQRLTVVLDARMKEDRVRFFQRRAQLSEGKFEIALPKVNGSADGARDAMRDLAIKSRNPVVALNSERDRDFFAGAGIDARAVIKQAPGYRLEGLEGLTAPLPPRLFDDDGMPMVPCPNLGGHPKPASDRQLKSGQ